MEYRNLRLFITGEHEPRPHRNAKHFRSSLSINRQDEAGDEHGMFVYSSSQRDYLTIDLAVPDQDEVSIQLDRGEVAALIRFLVEEHEAGTRRDWPAAVVDEATPFPETSQLTPTQMIDVCIGAIRNAGDQLRAALVALSPDSEVDDRQEA